MGVLFFAIAAFAVALPKSGAWMEAVKSVFGIVMLVAALYFLRNVVPALSSLGRPSPSWLVGSLALVVIGVVLGAVHLSFHDAIGVRARKALGVAVAVCGLFGAISGVLAPKHEEGAPVITWVHGEDEGLKVARALHRPALLDFYADWCLPCKELELKTFSRAEVARALGSSRWSRSTAPPTTIPPSSPPRSATAPTRCRRWCCSTPTARSSARSTTSSSPTSCSRSSTTRPSTLPAPPATKG